ncbi:MAG: S1 RNA-binding domain-containing protein [Microthrixaceae bacterium]
MSTNPELATELDAAAESEPETSTALAPELPQRPVIGQSAPAGSLPMQTVPASGGSPETEGSSQPSTPAPAARITEVTVLNFNSKEVEVRLADGRTGVIPSAEFSGTAITGQAVAAAVLAREDPKGRPVLSHVWALKVAAWERLEAAKKTGSPVIATVTKKVKGGLIADVGLRGFVPTSLFSETPGVTAESLVGTEVAMVVVEIDRDADRVVLSIRDQERRARRAAEREAIKALTPGVKVSGRVVNVEEYGAVVDLGGLRGLIHRSELTWGRLERTEDFVKLGEEVEVVVLEVSKSKRRISLSLRQVHPDPLGLIEVGSIHEATVVRVVEYGAFARLDEGGAEGLIHLSELTELFGYRPDELVTPGEQVMVKVLEVNMKRRRMGLSVRRVLVDD